jgi:hypothetical protein
VATPALDTVDGTPRTAQTLPCEPGDGRAKGLRMGERAWKAEGRTLVLGVVVAPGIAHELTAEIVAELEHDLNRRYGTVEWETELTVDRLVSPGASTTDVIEAARRKLLESRWDLGVVVTDLPLHVGRRPVTRQVSRTHGVAVVSLPALGAIKLRARLLRSLVELVGALLGGERDERRTDTRARLGRHWRRGVLRELTADTAERPGGLAVLFVPAVLLGNARLLLGMVRANRPWRFTARLYGALVAALAAGVLTLVVADHWRIATAMWWWRLTILCAVSIAATTAAIVVVHRLWEHAPDPRARAQVVLFNAATTATVVLGLLTLYAVLFALLAGAAWLAVTPSVFSHALGRDVELRDYGAIVWFFTSVSMLGGALGATLESSEAVREAAYTSSASEEVRTERPTERQNRAATDQRSA